MKRFRCSRDFFFLSTLIGHESFTSVFRLLNKTFDILVDWLIKVCFPSGTNCVGTVFFKGAVPESGESAPELTVSVAIKLAGLLVAMSDLVENVLSRSVTAFSRAVIVSFRSERGLSVAMFDGGWGTGGGWGMGE